MIINFNEKRIVLLNKSNNNTAGVIKIKYTKSGTCYCSLSLYIGNDFNKEYHYGEGKAGGYGYDKQSSAIADALKKAKIKTAGSLRESEFKSYPFTQPEDKSKLISCCKENNIIPVYPGSENEREAFDLFFNIIEC